MKLIITFILLNVFNVIIQTFKSIITVKGNKYTASIVNAIAYGLYTIVTIYLLCDLPLLFKALVVAICNLIGVFIVKTIEEKLREDRLWKIESTIPYEDTKKMVSDLMDTEVSYNYIPLGAKYTIFNFYCPTQKESQAVKDILKRYNAKYVVTESKTL